MLGVVCISMHRTCVAGEFARRVLAPRIPRRASSPATRGPLRSGRVDLALHSPLHRVRPQKNRDISFLISRLLDVGGLLAA
jgi:hypothetical protein